MLRADTGQGAADLPGTEWLRPRGAQPTWRPPAGGFVLRLGYEEAPDTTAWEARTLDEALESAHAQFASAQEPRATYRVQGGGLWISSEDDGIFVELTPA